MENLDDFMDAKASFGTIVKYYICFLPDILKMLTPVAVLVSSLFTVGRLSGQNEITAMKSGGVSLYRIMLPFVILCSLISGAQEYFNGWIVPKANEAKLIIERKYLDEKKEGPILNFYFRDSPTRNVTIQYYDPETASASGATIEEFTNVTQPRLLRKTSAASMRWDSVNKNWKMIGVVVRDFSGKNITNNRLDTLPVKINVSSSQLLELQKSPEQMTISEYGEYIKLLKRGGKDVSKLEIEYHSNIAFPFANLIVIFFSVPFASVKKKNGIAVQIAAAMIVSFAYLVFTKFGQSAGYNAGLNPVLSGWLANGIFLLIGLVILFRTKT
jgi:lipopolysaccharide export system permease protein